MRYYEEVVSPALDPPSQTQLMMHNTIKIHQDKLPGFNDLQYFDFHTLKQLFVLKKPLNSVCYKELVLGINFLEFMDLNEKLWHTQLDRKCASHAYENLGKHCDVVVEKFGMEYSRGSQTQVFLSSQETKTFNTDLVKYPIFPDTLNELRTLISCEVADMELFKTWVGIYKLSL